MSATDLCRLGPVADGRQRQPTGDLHFNFQHCPATLNGNLQPFNPASPVSASDRKAEFRVLEFNAHQRTLRNVNITAAINSRHAVKVDGQAASQWKLKCGYENRLSPLSQYAPDTIDDTEAR